MTEMSRSAYTDCASVRGIGVAVMCRVCGERAFGAQPRALLDAETMLLVDNRQAEAVEIHAFR